MKHSQKLLLNTFALCIKIFIKALVLLISTRLVLNELGASDYGLYNLIAGVISLLSFLSGSLMISTQRFLSYSMGENNQDKLVSVFNVSLLIHIVIAFVLGIVFISLQPLFFNGFIDIGDAPIEVAKSVYDIMIISAIVTMSTIPYSAVINAHEDMVFFAISEVLVIIVQLFAAIVIMFINSNLLVTYTWLMMLSIVVGFLSKFIWCKLKYKEVKISIRLAFDKYKIKEMLGFIGWNTLGSSAVLLRNQGVAIVLNYFWGTIANAAYGIANQINSLVLTFSSTLTTVFTPSLIQNKGAGNDERMIFLSIFSSKLSFLLSSVMAIPVLWNLHSILKIWLGDSLPEHTEIFTICIIIAFLFTQLYPGINRAIYATGQIKGYQIAISIFLTATIPLGVIAFQVGLPVPSILWALVLSQICCFASTIYFANRHVGLDSKLFIYKNAIPSIVLCGTSILIGNLANAIFVDARFFVFFLSLCVTLIYVFYYYKWVLNGGERNVIINLVKSVVKR